MDYLGHVVTCVLLTGAQGFLGQQLYTRLKSFDLHVIGTGRRVDPNITLVDLLNLSAVSSLITKFNPSLIINCAAFVPSSSADYLDARLNSNNMSILANIANSSDCPILHISSMTVYGDSLDCVPVREDQECHPVTPYGISKFKCESYLKSLDRKSISVRLPGLYGISRKSGLVFNTLLSALTNRPVLLPPKPVQWAAMHVDDAVDSIARLVLSDWQMHSSVNISYNCTYSINRFLDIIDSLIGSSFASSHSNIKHPDFSFDLSRLSSLNATASCSFESSLARFSAEIRTYANA